MKLEVVAQAGELFSGEVSEVVVNAAAGELGILPGHTPLLAVILPGELRYRTVAGESGVIHTSNGFVTVDSDHIMVVVESDVKSVEV
ncbi:hypothetical protein [Arcanobacterium hippocoleae]|uniref:F-type H+-transporting ATPase subunit epsilon n=1 Tax=Arcanobacterium hippocoleae TaxID=149017 RepID=A0ABU1T3L4_9ACTO|nr:hypothetical protein [Arcanobacterium hippocoleae]MDR6939985.1 F-type H+-transporting ATPase subunit epsilon [Arcanobacterium hippocoleae]